MANCKLITFEARKDGGAICFQNATPEAVAADIATFFDQQGYRLEAGTPGNGTYGIGSDLMRILFGAFARRYKFNILVQPSGPHIWLNLTKGMSGAMGGVIGYSAMNKETNRLFEAMKAYFA
jgi:hypothetical protein